MLRPERTDARGQDHAHEVAVAERHAFQLTDGVLEPLMRVERGRAMPCGKEPAEHLARNGRHLPAQHRDRAALDLLRPCRLHLGGIFALILFILEIFAWLVAIGWS
mgnify:CR=1 FL=1